MNRFKRKEVREGFETVDDEGIVVMKDRLKPKNENIKKFKILYNSIVTSKSKKKYMKIRV